VVPWAVRWLWIALWSWLLLLPEGASARPRTDPCESATRAVSVLWTARALADAVAPSWPGWRPALIEIRYHTREGWRLDVGRGQEASCPGLPLPARIRGRKRTARTSSIALERRGDRFWIELVEGDDGLTLEDELATLVHLHFHVHQYRHGYDYRDLNPRGNTPDPGWAWRNIPSTQDSARRMAVLAKAMLADGFTPEGGMALLTVRRQQTAALKGGHPRLPRAVALQERFEGMATYIENQLVVVEEARRILVEAGIDEAQLDPAEWRQASLTVDAGFPAATGYAAALVLDAAGLAWKAEIDRSSLDSLIELAAMKAVQ
jgi:hypothetical protein